MAGARLRLLLAAAYAALAITCQSPMAGTHARQVPPRPSATPTTPPEKDYWKEFLDTRQVQCGAWDRDTEAGKEMFSLPTQTLGVATFKTIPTAREPWGGSVADQVRQWVDRRIDSMARNLPRAPTVVIHDAISSEAEALTAAKKHKLRAILWGTAERSEASKAPVAVMYQGKIDIRGSVTATNRSSVEVGTVRVAVNTAEQYVVDLNLTVVGDDDSTTVRQVSRAGPSLILFFTTYRVWPELELSLQALTISNLLSQTRRDEARTLLASLRGTAKKGKLPREVHAFLVWACSLDDDNACVLEESERIASENAPSSIRAAVHALRGRAHWNRGDGSRALTEAEAALAAMEGLPRAIRLEQRLSIGVQQVLNGSLDVDGLFRGAWKIATESAKTDYEGRIRYVSLLAFRAIYLWAATISAQTLQTDVTFGQWRTAQEAWEAASNLRRRCGGANELLDAADDVVRGATLHNEGRCSEALPLFQRALQIYHDGKWKEEDRRVAEMFMVVYGAMAFCKCVTADGKAHAPLTAPWPEDVSAERLAEAIELERKSASLLRRLTESQLLGTEANSLNDLRLVTLAYAKKSGYPRGTGVLVVFPIDSASPFHPGDLILDYAGVTVRDLEALDVAMRGARGGQRVVSVRVQRGAEQVDLKLKRGALNAYVLLERGDFGKLKQPDLELAGGVVFLF